MSARSLALAVLAALLASASASAQLGDPLPSGATARLGTTRMRDLNSWAGAGLTPDGTRLLAFSASGVTRIDIGSGTPVGKATKLPATGMGARAELSADGMRAASTNYAGAVVWDTSTGATLAKIERRVPYGENCAAISADGRTVAVGGAKDDREKDKPPTALVWDVETQSKRCEVAVLQNQTAHVALSADGKLLATFGMHTEPNPGGNRPDPAKEFGRIVQFWDAATGKEVGRAAIDGFGLPVVVFAPDGRRAAVASGSGSTVQLVDPNGGAVQRQLFGRVGVGYRIAFSPNGRLVAAAAADGAVQLWNSDEGTLAATIESPIGMLAGHIRELRFTANDRAVVFAAVGFAAFVWDVPSGKLLSPAGGHMGPVTGVTFANDGKEVISGGQEGAIFRWNAATGKELGEVLLRPGGVPQTVRLVYAPVAFAPGGRIAIADRGTRAAYDLATGTPLFAVPTGYDTRALLAADARTLVVAPTLPFGQDPPASIAATVWDAATGQKLAIAELPAGELLAVATTPDRKTLLLALGTRPGKDAKTEFVLVSWSLGAGAKKLGQHARPGGYGTTFITAAPDNATALVSTPDGKLFAFDIASAKVIREIDTQRQSTTAPPAFAPDGKTFAVGLGGNFTASLGSVRIFDSANGQLKRTFTGHLGSVTSLAFAPDGQRLASGSSDTTVLIWDLK